MDLNIGFQGLALIQGQIYNPENETEVYSGFSRIAAYVFLRHQKHWNTVPENRPVNPGRPPKHHFWRENCSF